MRDVKEVPREGTLRCVRFSHDTQYEIRLDQKKRSCYPQIFAIIKGITFLCGSTDDSSGMPVLKMFSIYEGGKAIFTGEPHAEISP